MKYCRHRARAITLIEVLVVIAILATLMALLVPGVFKARELATRISCTNNLKHLGTAIYQCQDQFRKLPPAGGYFPMAPLPPTWSPDAVNYNKAPAAEGSIFYFLLPYVDETDLQMEVKTSSSWNINLAPPKAYICPANSTGGDKNVVLVTDWYCGVSSYAANTYVFGQDKDDSQVNFMKRAILPDSFKDGLAYTIIFTERYAVCGDVKTGRNAWLDVRSGPVSPTFAWDLTTAGNLPQIRPAPADCDPYRTQSPHAGGIVVGLADGSVRTVSKEISQTTWMHAIIPDDGNPLGSDWAD